ncbi:MAG: energy-coupling factor ABC transporter permease, partial [Candidatus Aminicenantia bacterium]
MHIPDGFISPQIYIPAYITSFPLWYSSFKEILKEIEKIPFISLLSAFSFVMQMVMVPLPFATSAHAIGVSILAIFFGIRIAFISETIVLLAQFFILGKGGLTVLPINAIALGFIIPLASILFFKFFRKISLNLSLFLAGYVSVLMGALFIGGILSLQFLLNKSYFPIKPSLLFTALLIPHLLFIGPAEGVYNIIGFQ